MRLISSLLRCDILCYFGREILSFKWPLEFSWPEKYITVYNAMTYIVNSGSGFGCEYFPPPTTAVSVAMQWTYASVIMGLWQALWPSLSYVIEWSSDGMILIRDNRKTLRKACSRASVATTNRTSRGLGANPDPVVRIRRLTACATDHCVPRYGTLN
jgi:hypothetical protein